MPPGTGICHQVNLEYLSRTVWTAKAKITLPGQVGRDRARLSGHAGRHRFAHHHGQRPVGARLGRRRHRGRGGHARPALFDAAAGGDRGAVERQAQGRHHRDRSRAHRDADAAQARRGRQIRRIFRAGSRQSVDRRPRHDRQHVARIRRDLRLLPDRRRHHPLSARHRPPGGSDRAGHRLRQGAGHVSHQEHAGPGLHRRAQARTVLDRAVARRAEAAAGPHRAQRGQKRLCPVDGQGIQQGRRDGQARPGRGPQASRSATATW